jgi:hypothetical protein
MIVNGSGRNEQSLQRTYHRCFLTSFGSFGHAVSEEIFFNQPIRNKNCLRQPCLLMDRDEMSKLYRGPSIDASYQVSVHLAKGFQRRRLKCEKLTDDGRQVMAKWAKNSLAIYTNSLHIYGVNCHVIFHSSLTIQSYAKSILTNRKTALIVNSVLIPKD